LQGNVQYQAWIHINFQIKTAANIQDVALVFWHHVALNVGTGNSK